jgi:hypothetical protein
MPVFAKLGAAAQVGDRVNTAVLHPEIHAAAESRRQRDVKAAIAGQQCWVLAVFLDSLLADDKHRNLRAVLRGVPNLLHVIGRRIDGGRVNFGPQRAFHIGQINAVNRGWDGERLESEKRIRCDHSGRRRRKRFRWPAAECRRASCRRARTASVRKSALCSYCARSLPPVTLTPCRTASACGISSFQFSRWGLVASATKTR